jgi:alpha-L-rhamnosidase
MFNDLAGIQSAKPGYSEIIIHPHPPAPGSNPDREPIHWVNAHYDCIHGRIVSNWRRIGSTFELHAVMPANTTATVYLPARSVGEITEDGKPLGSVSGIQKVRFEDGNAVLSVESGSYNFKSIITQP